MKLIYVFLSVGISFFFGYLLEFLISKYIRIKNNSLDSGLLTSINNQINEMKVKFDEIEKYRMKLYEEKEKNIKELIDNNNRFFKEMTKNIEKSDEEKEKRIRMLIESNQKFLDQQDKSKQALEKQRDAQIEDMKIMIQKFTQTIVGTKSRGIVGENILEEVLKNSIKVGLVKKNLKTVNGEVEFAWNLNDGKFIPIDSKLPDVFNLIDDYNNINDPSKRKMIVKLINEKVKKEISDVQKYQNLPNTIDSCMLVVPPAIIDISPELISIGKNYNVFVCTYKDVFPIAYTIQTEYFKLKKEGDLGEYKKIIRILFQILDKIIKKTDSIERAITIIKNSNDTIRNEIIKANHQKVKDYN